jgi:hypothetical protein
MKTGLNVQRALFLSELRGELEKTAKDVRKDELVLTAERYLEEGFSAPETTELLVADGFDVDMAESCMESISTSPEPIVNEGNNWGFEVEDSYGRITSNRDLGITITASSEEEAWAQAEASLSNNSLENLVQVFRV